MSSRRPPGLELGATESVYERPNHYQNEDEDVMRCVIYIPTLCTCVWCIDTCFNMHACIAFLSSHFIGGSDEPLGCSEITCLKGGRMRRSFQLSLFSKFYTTSSKKNNSHCHVRSFSYDVTFQIMFRQGRQLMRLVAGFDVWWLLLGGWWLAVDDLSFSVGG